MRFELYKIIDCKYVDSLQSGYLFMNTLNFFRGVEKNDAQSDCLEGVCGAIHKDRLKQAGMKFDPRLKKVIDENVVLISDYYGLSNLFCLYRLLIDDNKKLIWAPNKKLRRFSGPDIENKVVVRFKDTKRFLSQVSCAIQDGLEKHVIEYGILGNVVYRNVWVHADGPGTYSAFHKSPKYAYQNEWRLCLLRYVLNDSCYKFAIGDLSDIIEIIPLEQFIMHPEEIYPDYRVTNEDAPESSDVFQIFGSINAVNHLMFSYMDSNRDRFVRSDQAEADWHYARYLNLNGETEKIDAYLEMRMSEARDLDHLELLVQHRLAGGKWVKATDAFMFFINEVPDAIRTDPNRFFFLLHTILMQHQEPADAAKLYKFAINNYELQEELKQIIYSDIIFALGFYDKAILAFNKMRQISNDPVLDFNLAVSYLHTLDMTKAYSHLEAYECYFSHSQHIARKVSRLHKIIHCFYHKTQLETMPQRHKFQESDRDDDLDQVLKDRKTKDLYLGIDSLYQLGKEKKWSLLDRFREITICPLTIAYVIELYLQSGDPIFFHIIDQLIKTPAVRVRSPELDFYLALDISRQELKPYLKMEQAMYLQQQH